MVGLRLSENTAKNLNMAIDKVVITSDDTDGYCTFYAILNGIYAKKFGGTSKVTEEHFARTLTDIYPIVKTYKEDLRYATVLSVTGIIANINDELTKKGYTLNVYERKHNTFLVDVIRTKKKINKYMISVVKALYWYPDLEERDPEYVQLMFRNVDGSHIMDMGVCTDMSVILKDVEKQGATYRLRKLHICEKCRVCFVRKYVYDPHVAWCKGTNSQQFVFATEPLQTFEDHIHCRETSPVTMYYDLETSSSKEELKVISYSYVVIFRKDLLLPPIIVYRSALMCVEELLEIHIPTEIEDRIHVEDKDKLVMCAYDVVKQHPHALTQLMMMEMITIQRAIARAMLTRNFYNGVLHKAVVANAMKDYISEKCYLCGFDLDNVATIPFRQSVCRVLPGGQKTLHERILSNCLSRIRNG